MQPSGAIFLRKFKHGGREETRAVHVAVLLTDLLFFMKRTCFDMTHTERLIAAGIRPDCAQETVMWYRAQGDDYGLEKYVNEVESRHANNGEVFLAQRKPISEKCWGLHG